MNEPVRRVDVAVPSGLRLSGFAAVPPRPKALLVALHGGGMHAGYFHGTTDPTVSLVALAHELGYAALALDRPGYGESSDVLPDGLSIADQAQIVGRAVEQFSASAGLSVPVVIVAHSFGFKVALQIAASTSAPRLVGIDGSGACLRYASTLREAPSREGRDRPLGLTRDEAIHLFWGPVDLYPPGTLDRGRRPIAPVPLLERVESARWTDLVARIAPDVAVPVRFTVADHEFWWDVRPETLVEFAALFTSSPRFEVAHHARAGHNISLGWSARAYHLRAIAFAEECLTGIDG